MKGDSIQLINVKSGDMQSSLYGEETAPGFFTLLENDIFNCHLTFGTVIAASPAPGGLEYYKVVRKSPFLTKRFLLNRRFSADEWSEVCTLISNGGYCEVAMGGILILNLQSNQHFSLFTKLVEKYKMSVVEVVDDTKSKS